MTSTTTTEITVTIKRRELVQAFNALVRSYNARARGKLRKGERPSERAMTLAEMKHAIDTIRAALDDVDAAACE